MYIGLSPQVKLLIEAIGHTAESDLFETDDNKDTVLHLTDLLNTSTDNEDFHDTENKSPYSSADK